MPQPLTATEKVRVDKFTQGMTPETTEAMTRLFEHTKPGCDNLSYELMHAAHDGSILSSAAIATFEPLGLALPNGMILKPIKAAIRKAVIDGYLIMHDFAPPTLKPDPRTLDHH